jgi:hypothetical protein
VEVKPGEEATSVVVGWSVDKFVKIEEEKPAKKKVTPSPNGRKAATAKKAAAKKAKPAKKKATPKKASNSANKKKK